MMIFKQAGKGQETKTLIMLQKHIKGILNIPSAVKGSLMSSLT